MHGEGVRAIHPFTSAFRHEISFNGQISSALLMPRLCFLSQLFRMYQGELAPFLHAEAQAPPRLPYFPCKPEDAGSVKQHSSGNCDICWIFLGSNQLLPVAHENIEHTFVSVKTCEWSTLTCGTGVAPPCTLSENQGKSSPRVWTEREPTESRILCLQSKHCSIKQLATLFGVFCLCWLFFSKEVCKLGHSRNGIIRDCAIKRAKTDQRFWSSLRRIVFLPPCSHCFRGPWWLHLCRMVLPLGAKTFPSQI